MDLTFDDFDEVREHPMSDKFLVSLGQLVEGAFGKSVDEVLKYKPDFSAVAKNELDGHIKTSEYCKEKMQQLDLYQAVANLLQNFAPDFRATMEASLMNYIGIKYDLQGAGYGDLARLLYTCVTIG